MLFFKKKAKYIEDASFKHESADAVISVLDSLYMANVGDIVSFLNGGKKLCGYLVATPNLKSGFRPVVQVINDDGTIGTATYVAPRHIIAITFRRLCGEK